MRNDFSVFCACDWQESDLQILKDARRLFSKYEGHKNKNLKKEAIRHIKAITIIANFIEGKGKYLPPTQLKNELEVYIKYHIDNIMHDNLWNDCRKNYNEEMFSCLNKGTMYTFVNGNNFYVKDEDDTKEFEDIMYSIFN